MSATEKRTFSLPPEHTAFIDAKVRSGSYASGSEVIRAGLRALQERDAIIERWLHEEVGAAYDAVKSGDEKTYPAGSIFEEIRACHAAAKRPVVKRGADE
jgi:antitoxin ParD1/3/4